MHFATLKPVRVKKEYSRTDSRFLLMVGRNPKANHLGMYDMKPL